MTAEATVATLLEMDDFDPRAELLRMSREPGFMRPKNLDRFTTAYIEAALWSTSDSGPRLLKEVVLTSQLGGEDPPGEYMEMDAPTEEAARVVWGERADEDGEYVIVYDDAGVYEGDPFSIYRTRERVDDPLDENYSVDDIDDRTLAKMAEDCAEFQEKYGDLIDVEGGKGRDGAGHDFWLTRNSTGSGFWDGDWPEEVGEALTDASKEYGQFDLYVHDGVIYS